MEDWLFRLTGFNDYLCWLAFGVVLMILELVIPGTFIIWFGVGAVLTGSVVYFLDLGLSGQLASFIICSAVSLYFGFFVYRHFFGMNKKVGTQDRTGAKKYIGQSFEVVEAIQKGQGKIAVGDSVWLAKSQRDFPVGSLVKVKETQGTVLIVE